MIIDAEAAEVDRGLLAEPAARARLGAEVLARLEEAGAQAAGQLDGARDYQRRWRERLIGLIGTAGLLALPTVAFFPPALADAAEQPYTAYTMPVNVAGLPALALPVPSEHRLPGQPPADRPARRRGAAAGHRRGHRGRGRVPATAADTGR